jgi:hypothetical protein
MASRRYTARGGRISTRTRRAGARAIPLGVAGAGLASTLSIIVGVALLGFYFVKVDTYLAFRRELIEHHIVVLKRERQPQVFVDPHRPVPARSPFKMCNRQPGRFISVAFLAHVDGLVHSLGADSGQRARVRVSRLRLLDHVARRVAGGSDGRRWPHDGDGAALSRRRPNFQTSAVGCELLPNTE